MMVCAHGDVVDFCKERDMVICDSWSGDLRDYRGFCRVLVTDRELSESEYYFLKGELLARGIELVSIYHKDDKVLSKYMIYAEERRKTKYTARAPFGYYYENGVMVEHPEKIKVVHRVLELRDAGVTIRAIREDEGVRHPDGRKLSISTIQNIIKTRR